MSDDGHISADELTDEQIERVLNSHGFQKMLAYQKLADGIDVLEDQDEIFDSMISSITKQHGSIRSEDSMREAIELFRDEVNAFTEPLSEDSESATDADDLGELFERARF